MGNDDDVVATLPIRFSNNLGDRLQIHQYPLLNRSLQVPASAAASGKRVTARVKPNIHRWEVHVPADTRPDVWNTEKAQELGQASSENNGDKDGNTGADPRLRIIRMRSELIDSKSTYCIGVVQGGVLHLHAAAETQQFRPSLTYLDDLSRKAHSSNNATGSDSEFDDGSPPDPSESAIQASPKAKDKKSSLPREVQVSTRKSTDDKSTASGLPGGLSIVRREMLLALRQEEDEHWEHLTYNDEASFEAAHALESLLCKSSRVLDCKTDASALLGTDT